MRRAARVDDNQAEIVAALRRSGATVQSLATIGQGCPDLLVAYRQQTMVIEVKDGRKPKSARKLTPDEKEWIGKWKAPVYIVESALEAVQLLNIVCVRPPLDRGTEPF